MKFLDFYKEELEAKNENEVFEFLIRSLKPSNMLWSYFVNWEKVLRNTKGIEVELNILNSLVGKSEKEFDENFRRLVSEYPQIIPILPALAVRDGKNKKDFKILVDFRNKKLIYQDYNFSKDRNTKEDIEKYLIFIKETKIKDLLISKEIKNLVDYMIGVEAGLDSNARKNRGGTAMEGIVEGFIQDVCKRKDYRYLKEANAENIKKEFGYETPVDKSSRRYDFVINNGKELFIFETNFYGGGGSKLKSTAGEYRNLFDVLRGKHKFIWITDGIGWKGTSRALRETFDYNDYLLNLAMLERGILDYLTCESLEGT